MDRVVRAFELVVRAHVNGGGNRSSGRRRIAAAFHLHAALFVVKQGPKGLQAEDVTVA
jgi:hypothetical protein